MRGEPSERAGADSAVLERGYVQVYTGDGKGKTTAAVGLAVRAAGAGLRTFFAQFIKAERSGEIDVLERLGDRVICRRYGGGSWLRGKPGEEDVMRARAGLEEVRQAVSSGEYGLVVLDEADMAVWFQLLAVDDLLALIDVKPERTELVFTGRRADPRLIARADLVTEMREVKHYYRQGVLARRGIEN